MASISTYQKGLWAEIFVAVIYLVHGYRLLAMRYKTGVGEIDLVLRKGENVIFAEVKARQSLDGALESLTPQMKHRISKAALHFIAANPRIAAFDMRFDFWAVRDLSTWRWMKNAWALS